MPICEGHIIYFYYQKRFILACFSLSLLKNYGSFFKKVKMNSLIFLSFAYYISKKLVEKILDTYKTMIKKNSLI